MSYVALSTVEITRLKCEQHLGHALYIGQRSSENVVCAKPSPTFVSLIDYNFFYPGLVFNKLDIHGKPVYLHFE